MKLSAIYPVCRSPRRPHLGTDLFFSAIPSLGDLFFADFTPSAGARKSLPLWQEQSWKTVDAGEPEFSGRPRGCGREWAVFKPGRTIRAASRRICKQNIEI
ncbi:unnamed protein product [Nesidiocoris tenuis]|uniref:Uncharacterized protein n=1 Tax=Nesidiocoris tenuis TaxID=355587 RepID=A0A6H5GAX7_9HEMI|nr:unnamed protein product [Nesidiocoris tenuis]